MFKQEVTIKLICIFNRALSSSVSCKSKFSLFVSFGVSILLLLKKKLCSGRPFFKKELSENDDSNKIMSDMHLGISHLGKLK